MTDSDRPRLWRNHDFLKLWAGQTVSTFGSLITRVALPFVAILFLHASPMQVALLSSTGLLAGFLVGLFAGVVVDRFARRPILIVTDFLRAFLVLVVPLAALAGFLRMELLYAVAFLSGVLSTLFDVAYTSYLPSLVEKDELMEGNSKLTATASVSEILAFSSGGWLVQCLSAPFALVIDAVTYLVSAASLLAIRRPELREREPSLSDTEEGLNPRTMQREIAEGLHLVGGHSELRALALSQWMMDFGSRLFGTLFMLFVTRDQGIAPGLQGMIYAIGGFTSLGGALIAGRVTDRLGLGRTLIMTGIGAGLGMIGVALAPASILSVVILCLVLNQILTDPCWTILEIGRVSLRQGLVDERIQGRVNATFRAGSMAVMLAGTLLAGFLGERIGVQITLFIGAALVMVAPLFIALSPLARRRAFDQ